MKFSVMQDKLADAIQIVQRAVATKSTMPILKGIYLRTHREKGLQLIANDLEIGIEYWIKADIKEEGTIVLPAKELTSIVRELPPAEINFNVDLEHYQLHLQCLNSEFTLNGFEASEFPQLPEVETAQKVVLKASKLKKMIDEVKFATSNDQTQPSLTGGLLNIEDNNLSLVATNTYRLAFSKDDFEGELEENINAILPGRTLQDLSHLLDDDHEVELLINNNYVRFNFQQIVFISRLIEGQFPNYKVVIPKEYNTRVKVDKKELQKAVKRVSLIARLDSNVISLKVDRDQMDIVSVDSDHGSAHETLEIETEGPEQRIDIDASYLLDVLKVLDEEVLNIELIGPVNPMTVRKDDSDNYIYLIMPVRPNS